MSNEKPSTENTVKEEIKEKKSLGKPPTKETEAVKAPEVKRKVSDFDIFGDNNDAPVQTNNTDKALIKATDDLLDMDLLGGPPVTNTNTNTAGNLNQNNDLDLFGNFTDTNTANIQPSLNTNDFDMLGGGGGATNHLINPQSTTLYNDSLSMTQLNGRVEYTSGSYYLDLQ